MAITRYEGYDETGLRKIWSVSSPNFSGDLAYMGGEFYAQYQNAPSEPVNKSRLVIISIMGKTIKIVKILKEYTTDQPRGCAYDGNFIYTLNDESGDVIEKIDPKTGSVVWSKTISGISGTSKGMCYFQHNGGMFFAICDVSPPFLTNDIIRIYDHNFSRVEPSGFSTTATLKGLLVGVCHNGQYFVTNQKSDIAQRSTLNFYDVKTLKHVKKGSAQTSSVQGGITYNGLNYIASVS